VPKVEVVRDLFSQATGHRNLLVTEIRAWCKSEGWQIEKDGPEYLVWTAAGVQVDLWFATPESIGSVLLCRTGSKEHNVWLSMRAMDRGAKWHPNRGLYLPGRRIVGATEVAIYEALGLPLILPCEREAKTLARDYRF